MYSSSMDLFHILSGNPVHGLVLAVSGLLPNQPKIKYPGVVWAGFHRVTMDFINLIGLGWSWFTWFNYGLLLWLLR